MNEQRKRILQMVEEGKLNVEEALTLLEELDKANTTMEKKQEELLGELSSAVKYDEAKKEESANHKYQSAKEKIFDFVDSAIKKIKDLDLDFNFGSSVEISHVFHQGEVHLKEVDIDLANGQVKVVPWENHDVRIECNAKVYRVDNQEQARQNFIKDVTFAIEGERLRFATQQKWMKIEATVFIPQSEYDRVKIRMFNGPITSENLTTRYLNTKTANGKITMDRINGHSVEVETANGHIAMNQMVVDELEAETINGAIKTDGDYRKLELRSFNGNIMCSIKGSRCEKVEAKTTTGAIELFVPQENGYKGELKSNLGNYKVELDGIEILEEKSEKVQKHVKFKSYTVSDRLVSLYADTKTGNISVKKG